MKSNESKLTKYTCIDGINYAVPAHVKYVFECKRGFLHGKDRKPEVVVHGKNIDWTPAKVTLHAENEKFQMKWPLRIDQQRDDWEDRVFSTTDEIQNPNLPLVDCLGTPCPEMLKKAV
jgi:hypothetical protein